MLWFMIYVWKLVAWWPGKSGRDSSMGSREGDAAGILIDRIREEGQNKKDYGTWIFWRSGFLFLTFLTSSYIPSFFGSSPFHISPSFYHSSLHQ
jgi:hypothetical protein